MEYPIKLSILICHLENRKEQLNSLLNTLNAQVQGKPVEILVETDSGEITVGRKRNKLVERAAGEYCAFIDDDDEVVPDYIDLILAALEGNPDCVGIEGLLFMNGGKFLFKHSIRFQGWYDDGLIFYRTPNHLNPIKRNKMLEVPFMNISYGEDGIFSNNIRLSLKTENYIGKPIYLYTPGPPRRS